MMAVHFGADNAPNGFMSKPAAVLGMPLALLGLHWLCILAGKTQLEYAGKRLGRIVLWIIPAVSIFSGIVMYGYALDGQFDVGRLALVFVGLIFAITGNYMPKVRQNFVLGIRLPTTLADEDNWNRTHRFAGPLWVACGLLAILLGLLGAGHYGLLTLAALIAPAVVPILYSLALAMRKKS